jgi:tRNA threonylcarbamoyladenosine modification (KEOPS) complex  Pcc1 subunit
MKTEVEIEAERPEELKEILAPSLENGESVKYRLKASDNSLNIRVETESLGALRGCTDTVFRLSSIAVKQY